MTKESSLAAFTTLDRATNRVRAMTALREGRTRQGAGKGTGQGAGAVRIRPTMSLGRRRARRSELLVALAFILPAAVGFGAFYVVPTIRGIYLSFTDYNLMSAPSYIGFDNYVRLATDPLF